MSNFYFEISHLFRKEKSAGNRKFQSVVEIDHKAAVLVLFSFYEFTWLKTNEKAKEFCVATNVYLLLQIDVSNFLLYNQILVP